MTLDEPVDTDRPMIEQMPGRRHALRLAGLLGAGVVASTARASAARAAFTYAPDVVLFCGPTLAPGLRRTADLYTARTGVPVRIIATADQIFAGQIERGERNDICVALAPVAADLRNSGLVDPQSAVGTWRDRLVVARDGAAPALPNIPLAALLESGRVGVVDPSDNAIVKTPILLDRLGLAQSAGLRLVGEVDTGGVAYLLAHQQADLGIIFVTDQRAARFSVAATIPDEAYPPVRYATVLNKKVLSRHAAPFLTFLASPAARASLTSAGLEIEA